MDFLNELVTKLAKTCYAVRVTYVTDTSVTVEIKTSEDVEWRQVVGIQIVDL